MLISHQQSCQKLRNFHVHPSKNSMVLLCSCIFTHTQIHEDKKKKLSIYVQATQAIIYVRVNLHHCGNPLEGWRVLLATPLVFDESPLLFFHSINPHTCMYSLPTAILSSANVRRYTTLFFHFFFLFVSLLTFLVHISVDGA